jgi:hypothetical protein
VTVVCDVLHIKRAVVGAEIDRFIADVLAHKAMAIEHRRRADLGKRELAAKSFQMR